MLAVRIAFAALAVAVAAGLWLAFRPQAPAPAVAVAGPVPAAPAEKAFVFVLRDGKRISGPAALQVRQGERVKLRIESNMNDELHLHGYELKLRIDAGAPATLEFAASRSGRFELELHKR